jgi:hypothetical protein
MVVEVVAELVEVSLNQSQPQPLHKIAACYENLLVTRSNKM